MAKTTRKTTTKKTAGKKSTTPKESPRAKRSGARSSAAKGKKESPKTKRSGTKTTTRAKSKTTAARAKTTAAKTTKTAVTRTRKAKTAKKTAGETEVTVDRRHADRRTNSEPVAVERRKIERRAKVTRRRQIDPTTCERDYSEDEVEFMSALDDYKRASGRMFPTCSEILEVIRGLGYAKLPAGQDASTAAPPAEGVNPEPDLPSSDESTEDPVDDDIFAEVLV